MSEMGWTVNNSALSALEQCGEKFRRRYIEKETMPGNVRMKRGTAVHAVAAEAHRRQMVAKETGGSPAFALPSIEEAGDLAATAFENEMSAGAVYDADDMALGIEAVAGREKDTAVNLSELYVGQVAPHIDPVAVERKITVKPKDSDLVIHGTMDLIEQTQLVTGELVEAVRDQKTSTSSPSKRAADSSQQLTMYAMLRAAEVGVIPSRVTLDYLVETPAKKLRKHVQLNSTRGPADIQSLVARINVAVEAVKRGVFVPARPEDVLCSPRYCEYFPTCPYVQTNRVSVIVEEGGL